MPRATAHVATTAAMSTDVFQTTRLRSDGSAGHPDSSLDDSGNSIRPLPHELHWFAVIQAITTVAAKEDLARGKNVGVVRVDDFEALQVSEARIVFLAGLVAHRLVRGTRLRRERLSRALFFRCYLFTGI